jgi:hypothetical protein
MPAAILAALKCHIGDFRGILLAPDTLSDVHAVLGYWPAIRQRQRRYPMSAQFWVFTDYERSSCGLVGDS